MRYLTQSKTGIWYFRFQIPTMQRALFGERREIKYSLRTTVFEQAKVIALELELKTRKTLLSQSQESTFQTSSYKKPTTLSKRKSMPVLTPLELLELYCSYKSEYVSPKTLEGQKAKCVIVLELLNKANIRDIRRADAEYIRYQLKNFPANLKSFLTSKGLLTYKYCIEQPFKTCVKNPLTIFNEQLSHITMTIDIVTFHIKFM